MEQLKQAALAISIFAAVYDAFTGRIPNWLTFSAITLGLGARFYFEGRAGVVEGSLGVVVAFALFAPLFFFGMMGGGDVKLLMAVGALLNMIFVAKVALVSILVGGVYALIDTAARGRLAHIFRVIQALLLGWLRPQEAKDMVDSKRKFPFGFAIAVAVAVVIASDQWKFGFGW